MYARYNAGGCCMKPEAQRIALAEAFPSVIVRSLGSNSWNYRNPICNRVLPCIDGDPLKDLNAMHEAEKVLTNIQAIEYAKHLHDLVLGKGTSHQSAEYHNW